MCEKYHPNLGMGSTSVTH